METLKKGLTATMTRLDQFLSHHKREHAQVEELRRRADSMRDELAAWAVYYQQQPDLSGIPEKQPEEEETHRVPASVITTMACKGDIEIEVSNPGFVSSREVHFDPGIPHLLGGGAGSLILDRPLSRDFLSGTSVRLLTDADQYRAESEEVYLHNPRPSNSGERENFFNPHGGNGNMGNQSQQQLGERSGNQGTVETPGLETYSHSGNGGGVELDATTTPLPCGKPRPPIERTGTPIKGVTNPANMAFKKSLPAK